MTVDHYRWRSLDELIPVALTQPAAVRPANHPPGLDDVREALRRVQARMPGGVLPDQFGGELYVHLGLDMAAGQWISLNPDTWLAVIKFLDEYQIPKPKVA